MKNVEEISAGNFRYIGDVGPLFDALAKAQSEFLPMQRDSEVSFERRNFRYASLAEVLDSVRPALNKYGIALLQPFDGNEVVTVLAFGAARIEVSAFLPAWEGMQKLGSALTYIKRYQIKSLLGVNDGEDDDGNEADGTGRQAQPRRNTPVPQDGSFVTPETKDRIKALALQAGLTNNDLQELSIRSGTGQLTQLTESGGKHLLGELQKLQVQP